MIDSEIFKVLKKQLSVCSYNNTHSKEEIKIRCPYCGDSSKDNRHAHFYIENIEPYYFFCQRCSVAGTFSSDTMKDLGIYDNELVSILIKSKKFIAEQNRSAINISNKKRNKNKHFISNITIPPSTNDPIEKKNLDYINGRIGSSFTPNEIQKLKLILNIQRFYDHNNLDDIEYEETFYKKLDDLDSHYVGFLSYDRNFLTLRNIDCLYKYARRYEIWNLLNNRDNTKKFYTISTRLNLLNPNFKLIMAEGIFDILSVWNNIYDRLDEENVVFLANNGTGYKSPIMNFLRLGFIGMNIEIYSDSDFLLKYEKYITSLKNLPIGEVNIFYNKALDIKNKTDFGVKKEDIIIKKFIAGKY